MKCFVRIAGISLRSADVNRDIKEGDSVGILIGTDKELHNYLSDHFKIYGHFQQTAYATNDPRMLKALKLIGYATVGRVKIQGIERFMYN
jgi:hypothetical protein